MDFHCPQCTRSFRVTADGEVEAGDDGGVGDLGGLDPVGADDPFAAFAQELDLTMELQASGASDEELASAGFGGPGAGVPPLPDPGGPLSLDGLDDVVGGPATGPLVPPAPPQAAPAQGPPPGAPFEFGPPSDPPTVASPPAPPASTLGDEAGLSEQDLALIGSYHKTSDHLSHGTEVIWTGDAPDIRGQQPAPQAPEAPQAPQAPEQPTRATFGAATGGDPFAPGPDSAFGGAGADDPFAAPGGGGGEPFAAPASDPFAAPAAPAGDDPFAMPAAPAADDPFAAPAAPGGADPFATPAAPEGADPFAAPAAPAADPFAAPVGVGADPFAAPARGAADPFAAPVGGADPFAMPADGGAASGGSGGVDGLFDLGPLSNSAPAAGGVGGASDPDALFDLDLEIGSPPSENLGATVSMGPVSEPASGSFGGGPASGAVGGGAGGLGESQPLLEEMDFSSLLQEDDGAGGSIFDVEPGGVFGESEAAPEPGAVPDPDAAYEIPSSDGLLDLDIDGGDAPSGHQDMGGGGMALDAGASESGVGPAFKPAKVPARRSRSRGAGAKYLLLALLIIVGLGLGLGQVPGIGYFGMDLIFPEEQVKLPTKPKRKVKTEVGSLQDDTVAAYQDQMKRLEKALELHPDDEGARKALVDVLDRFSIRFPDEFAHNKKYQRRLEELAKKMGDSSGTFSARQKLRAGDAEAAREALERFGRRPSDGKDIQTDYELLYGQIEMRLGNYDAAIPHFAEVLKLDPKNVAARYLQGRCYRLSGKFPEARASFEAVLKKSPKHDSARIGLAELRLEMGEGRQSLELAKAILEDALARKLTEQTFAAHRLLARIYGQLGELEQQKSHMEEALSIKPFDEQLLLSMAAFLHGQGKVEEATERLASCWAQGCASADYFLLLGDLYRETNDTDKALESLRRGLKSFPKAVPLMLLEGRVLHARGEVVAAREAYRRAVAADPANGGAYAALADLLIAVDQREEARKILVAGIEKVGRPEPLMERLAGIYERQGHRSDAQKVLGDLVDRDPLNFDARLKLAVLLKQGGLVAEALTHFEFLYRNNQIKREVRIEYADALRVARRYEAAERELRQLLLITPDDLGAKVQLGAVLVEQGKFNEAEGFLKAVVEKEPRNGMAFYYLGKLELARGEKDAALEFLAQAVRSEVPLPEYRFEYAETLMQVGGRRNVERAADAYTGIVTSQTSGKDKGKFERMTDVYLHRGQARMLLRRYDAALDDFEKAMKLNPLRADAVTAFASGLIKKKRLGEAERYLKTVIAENPKFAPAHYQLALVHNGRRDLKSAKREFLKAILEDDTRFPEASRYLGFIYREQRLDREAKRYFKRYLELAPNATDRADIERLLSL